MTTVAEQALEGALTGGGLCILIAIFRWVAERHRH